MKYILCITLLLISFQGVSQLSPEKQRIVDSLNKVIKEAEHDTSIAQAYIMLGEKLGGMSLDTVIILCNKAKTIAEKTWQIHLLVKRKSCLVKGYYHLQY